jgi:hypothetical protein
MFATEFLILQVSPAAERHQRRVLVRPRSPQRGGLARHKCDRPTSVGVSAASATLAGFETFLYAPEVA